MSKPVFIELTAYHTGENLLINTAHITTVFVNDSDTVLTLNEIEAGSSVQLRVTQSFDTVARMLAQAGNVITT